MVRELRFAPPRRFRFDFAWPSLKVAVEIHGSTFTRGRHSRGKGQASDYDKLNLAQSMGWIVLQFGSEKVASHRKTREVIRYVCSILKDRMNANSSRYTDAITSEANRLLTGYSKTPWLTSREIPGRSSSPPKPLQRSRKKVGKPPTPLSRKGVR